MAKMKVKHPVDLSHPTPCVALLADQVGSRDSNRAQSHAAILDSLPRINQQVPSLDALRVTVGDELQGVYPTLGQALEASYRLRLELAGTVDLRIGLGRGEVVEIDAEHGIQDGSAWYAARDAIGQVASIAQTRGYRAVRTALVNADADEPESPLITPALQLIDSALGRLRTGAAQSLLALIDGHDNQSAAEAAGISPSANSQRIDNNDLRILADAIRAVIAQP